MRFSVSTQSFYDDDYESNAIVDDLPSDVEVINNEQYANFFNAINSAQVVYLAAGAYTISQPRPDAYHSWDTTNNAWVMTDAAAAQKSADLLEQNVKQKSALLTIASAAIAPLQDAVDLGIATNDELEQLTAWKKYRVLLTRVDTAKPDWPTPPVQTAS